MSPKPACSTPFEGSARNCPDSRLGEKHVAYLDLAAEVERRREAGQTLLSVYRIYLRDLAGSVISGHTVAVESDRVAFEVASIFCCEAAVGTRFEIWKGETPMGSTDTPAFAIRPLKTIAG